MQANKLLSILPCHRETLDMNSRFFAVELLSLSVEFFHQVLAAANEIGHLENEEWLEERDTSCNRF